LIFQSIHSEEKRKVLFEKIKQKPKHASIVNTICKNLLCEVEGEARRKVNAILLHPEIRKHYLKYLHSINNRRKVKGLLYLKDAKILPDGEIQRVVKLLDHKLHYLAHASALAILGSAKSQLHKSTIIHMCNRSEDCKYTLVELFWEFWKNEFVSKESKNKCFQVLLSSEDISLEVKGLLVRVISSLDEHHFAIYFHDILKFTLSSEYGRTRHSFLASLITAIAKSDYAIAEREIMEAYSIENIEVKLSVVKALWKFKTNFAINHLSKIYLESTDSIKKEISYLVKDDKEMSRQILISGITTKYVEKFEGE